MIGSRKGTPNRTSYSATINIDVLAGPALPTCPRPYKRPWAWPTPAARVTRVDTLVAVRKLLLVSAAGTTVNAGLLLAAFVSDEPSFVSVAIAFPLAVACSTTTLYQVNNRSWERLRLDRMWALLLELRPTVRVGLALLMLALLAPMLWVGTNSDVAFPRAFIAIGTWMCASSAALAYAFVKQRERGKPLEPSRRSVMLFRVGYIAVGLLIAAVFLVQSRNTVVDVKATHDELNARFGNASWHPHLVAANTTHGLYIVYLDTHDPAVQAAACADLIPEAAKLGRRPDLYFASGRHGTYERTC